MQATFLLKNLTEHFYQKLEGMNIIEQYEYVRNVHNIKPKIGLNNSFAEQVDFNMKIKSGAKLKTSKINKRRGYNLLVFEL